MRLAREGAGRLVLGLNRSALEVEPNENTGATAFLRACSAPEMTCAGRTILSQWSVGDFEIVDAVYRAQCLDPFHVHQFAHLSIVLWGKALEVRDSRPLCYSTLFATGQNQGRGHAIYFPVDTRVISITTLRPITSLAIEPVLLKQVPFPLRKANDVGKLLQSTSIMSQRQSGQPAWLREVTDAFPWHSDIPLTAAAKLAGVSQSHFDRVFKRATGQSPRERRRTAKIEAASRLLLESNIPIAEVALEAGFSSQSHLTAALKRNFGLTPLNFRRYFAQTS